MAITIAELIDKKDELAKRKTRLYDIETSAGTFTFKLPTRKLLLDNLGKDADALILYECSSSPNLKDQSLQQAFNCFDPLEIVEKIFDAGEVPSISAKLIELAGFKQNLTSQIHSDIKN